MKSTRKSRTSIQFYLKLKKELFTGDFKKAGIIPEFSYEYDPTESFHTNLENFIAKAQEHFNI